MTSNFDYTDRIHSTTSVDDDSFVEYRVYYNEETLQLRLMFMLYRRENDDYVNVPTYTIDNIFENITPSRYDIIRRYMSHVPSSSELFAAEDRFISFRRSIRNSVE